MSKTSDDQKGIVVLSLQDTPFIKWEDNSTIVIVPKGDINVDITQKIKKLMSTVKTNDLVLGINANRIITHTGRVAAIEKQDVYRIKLEWENQDLQIEAGKVSFNNKIGFEYIQPGMFGSWIGSNQFLNTFSKITDLAITDEIQLLRRPKFVDTIPGKIQTPVRKKIRLYTPPPLKKSSMKRKYVSAADNITVEDNKRDTGGIIKLFYGTNRKRKESKDINKSYGNERDELKYGFCEVSIPRGHIQGELERPFHFLLIEFAENEKKHVVLKKVDQLDEKSFFANLKSGIKEAADHDALLFIHGYNTTFAEAARRTAQIAWDVPFNGMAGFFSWPSAGKLEGYPHDEANADWSVSHLQEFITKLLLKTGIKKLHIIAHSMGNKLLSFTLKNLSNDKTVANKLKIIHQIILGAPDIDRGIFEKDILPNIKNIGTRKTIYTSDKDIALKASEKFRLGLPRLGEAGEDLFVSKDSDTIDASNVKSKVMGHGYIFDTKELLSDLFYLISTELAPPLRRLKARKWKGGLLYWLFPE